VEGRLARLRTTVGRTRRTRRVRSVLKWGVLGLIATCLFGWITYRLVPAAQYALLPKPIYYGKFINYNGVIADLGSAAIKELKEVYPRYGSITQDSMLYDSVVQVVTVDRDSARRLVVWEGTVGDIDRAIVVPASNRDAASPPNQAEQVYSRGPSGWGNAECNFEPSPRRVEPTASSGADESID